MGEGLINPHILHIVGPFFITWYGALLAAGLSVFLLFAYRSVDRQKIMTGDQFFDIALSGLVGGLVGGKLLFLLGDGIGSVGSAGEFVQSLLGGFAIMGGVLGAVLGIVSMAWVFGLPLLPVLDLAGTYALTAHAIARWGCFMAGCCYGVASTSSWFYVVYTNPASLAPLHIPLIPAQLIMSGLSLVGFLAIRFLLYPLRSRPAGLLFACYLLWESGARFLIDFVRDDRIEWCAGLSLYQWVALAMCTSAISWMVYQAARGHAERRRKGR